MKYNQFEFLIMIKIIFYINNFDSKILFLTIKFDRSKMKVDENNPNKLNDVQSGNWIFI